MRLPWSSAAGLFVLGAVVGPIGDHLHVLTNTTHYEPTSWPRIGSMPLWFPLFVGTATVLLAELRLHLGPAREVTVRQGVAAIAAVLGIYAVSALLIDSDIVAATVLIGTLAALTWTAFGDVPAITVGAVAAALGPLAEIIGAAGGGFSDFSYNAHSDQLAGVAPWLPGLYFAFGVAAAVLAELSAFRGERRSARTSTDGRGRTLLVEDGGLDPEHSGDPVGQVPVPLAEQRDQ